MVDDARRWIDTANGQLRGGNIGVALELQGKQNWIYLRGTFPPKPNDRRTRPYSTKISLKMKACDRDSVARAELIAKEVGLDLNKGTFDWRKFSDFEAEPNSAIKTIDQWVEELERGWWLNKDVTDTSKQNTWRCGYQTVLDTLPRSGELTQEKLVDWITTHTKPCTRRRLHYTTCARKLAELASLPTETIVMLAKGYSAKPVNPRRLPSDSTISQVWEALQDPGWQHLFGLQATYGLRNHECFFADYSEFPVIRVRDESKTGTRPVKPLYPEWAEQWGLSEPIYPETLNLEDQTLGCVDISAKFNQQGSEINKAEKILRFLLKAGKDTAKVLELVKPALNQMPLFVQRSIQVTRVLAMGARGKKASELKPQKIYK